MIIYQNLSFFNFIKKSKGILKFYSVIPICYLDTLLMLLGSIYGLINYILGEEY